MRSSILARIPGFRQRIIPEPSFPSQGSQARGTRLVHFLIWALFNTRPQSTHQLRNGELAVRMYEVKHINKMSPTRIIKMSPTRIIKISPTRT